MKKVMIASALLLSAAVTVAQVKMPAPSPAQTVEQEFGQGTIEVVYSRPAAKGRKVFGDLVPYNKLWRTGANAATRITFTEPVEIGGKTIDTGSYAIYTIPSMDSWEVIINKGYKNGGVVGYKESEDVVRIKVQPKKLKDDVESFTIQFANVLPASCDLQLMWQNTSVSVPIKSNFKDKLRKQIESALQSDKKPYWQAAQFYKDYDNNNALALENVSKALDQNPKAFWMWLYKARLQREMGDKTGAAESAKKSLELATAEKNDDYIKMNNELLKELKK